MLENYSAAAEKVPAQGGHVAFEWPKSFFLADSEGKPHRKLWRVVTSSWRLAKNLNAHKCKHPHDFVHSQVAGNKAALTAYYPKPWSGASPQACTQP